MLQSLCLVDLDCSLLVYVSVLQARVSVLQFVCLSCSLCVCAVVCIFAAACVSVLLSTCLVCCPRVCAVVRESHVSVLFQAVRVGRLPASERPAAATSRSADRLRLLLHHPVSC